MVLPHGLYDEPVFIRHRVDLHPRRALVAAAPGNLGLPDHLAELFDHLGREFRAEVAPVRAALPPRL